MNQMRIFLFVQLCTCASVLCCMYENAKGKAGLYRAESLQKACNVSFPCWIGDGWCDDSEPGYNTAECDFDGGDCCQDTCVVSNTFHVYECGINGYSCKETSSQPSLQPTTCRRTTNPSTSSKPPSNSDVPDHTSPPTTSSTQARRSEFPSMGNSRAPTAPTSSYISINPTAPWRRSSSPTTAEPSMAPSTQASHPGAQRTAQPNNALTMIPTHMAATQPTIVPTTVPTAVSFRPPTTLPSCIATSEPTGAEMSGEPTAPSTLAPTAEPTSQPTCEATSEPTVPRTTLPTVSVNAAPTISPTAVPTCEATSAPTVPLTAVPTVVVTAAPTTSPTANPTVLLTTLPIAEPTLAPTSRSTVPPVSRSPTGTPTSALPTQLPRSAPSGAPNTGPPTQQPSVAPTRTLLPTARLARAPTAQRVSASPSVLPSALPTHLPTGTTPGTETSAPSVLPVYVTASLSFSFLMVNTTLPPLTAQWSLNDSTAIERGTGAVLRPLGFVEGTELTEAHLALRTADVPSESRQLRGSVGQLIVWNATVRVVFNTTVEFLQLRNEALYIALNESLYSGQLQQSMRAASRERPIAETLLAVCLCATASAEQCLQSIAPAPQSSAAQIPCDRNTAMWNLLYNMPTQLPWYLVWLIILGATWMLMAVRAAAQGLTVLREDSSSGAPAILCAMCSVLRFGYMMALLVAEYWRSARDGITESLACIEFIYLGRLVDSGLQQWTFYDIHIMVLLRDIFYSCLVILCCSWMRTQVRHQQRQLDSLNRPNDPGLVRKVLACTVLCIFAAAAVLAILLAHGIETLLKASVIVQNDQWAVYLSQATQLLSGILLLLITVRFSVSMRAIRRLIEAYIQGAGVREEEDVLSALEAEAVAVDEALSPRPLSGALGRCDGGLISDDAAPAQVACHGEHVGAHDSPGVLRPTARPSGHAVVAIIALCAANALLMSVTASAAVLSSPLSALLLYSVGARVLEMLLIGAILRSTRRLDVPPVDDRRDGSSRSLTETGIPAGDIPSKGATGSLEGIQAPQLQANKLATDENYLVLRSRTTECVQPSRKLENSLGCDQHTVWAYNKKWPWVFTPSGDVQAKHDEVNRTSVDNGRLGTSLTELGTTAPQYDKCRNDSPNDDSTDSGLQYFT